MATESSEDVTRVENGIMEIYISSRRVTVANDCEIFKTTICGRGLAQDGFFEPPKPTYISHEFTHASARPDMRDKLCFEKLKSEWGRQQAQKAVKQID
jgi:hypothetical protein